MTERRTGIRRAINVAGLHHGANPIPAASRVGPLLMTGGIHGVDRDSGAIGASLDEQVSHMFANLRAIVEAGGGNLDQVVSLTVFIREGSARAAVNSVWQEYFPEPENRPARHTQIRAEMPEHMLVQCVATAFIAP